MDAIRRLIKAMPKAELHLHIEGTLEPEMMMQLAVRNGIKLPYADVDAIRRAFAFGSLQDFLDIYYAGMSVLVTSRDFFDLAFAYLNRMHAENVRHVEIFFDPQGHTSRGISFDTVLSGLVDALERAKRDYGITPKLIMCFLRHLPEEDAFATLKHACRCKEHFCRRFGFIRKRLSTVQILARIWGGAGKRLCHRGPCRRGRPAFLCLRSAG
jgi:adenosine deaminase